MNNLKKHQWRPSGPRKNKLCTFQLACGAYIEKRARQLGISEIQFIENACGLAGPQMGKGFKYAWGGQRPVALLKTKKPPVPAKGD